MDKKEIQKKVDNLQAELDKLNKLLEEKEHRFYKGQPVLFAAPNSDEWEKGHLYGISDSEYCKFQATPTDSWSQCKPDPEAPSLPNWIEWEGGECPVDDKVFVLTENRDGVLDIAYAEEECWDHQNFGNDIIRYAVITKPEFI